MLAQLPPDAADAASESIGAAVQIAASLPGEIGQALRVRAGDAFTTAFGNSLLAAAGVSVVIGIAVFITGRRREVGAEVEAPELETA